MALKSRGKIKRHMALMLNNIFIVIFFLVSPFKTMFCEENQAIVNQGDLENLNMAYYP